MKYFKKIKTEETVIEFIECDICHKKFYRDDFIETQEFHCIDFIGGYGSIFGDEARIQCDLCQNCLREKLGSYLRIGPDWIEKEAENLLEEERKDFL